MNAPVENLPHLALEWLPVDAICPSETAAQARRRKRFTKESIAELAANVRAQGVIQPVIVRKLPGLRDMAAYELVAGERRWLAAREAGLAHVPALVRDIADDQLLGYQLSENLKRASLDAVEEAEGYRDLLSEAAKRGEKMKAEDIAQQFGISRRHVYNRLRLLDIKHPAAAQALQDGTLDATKALRVARYGSIKLQAKAFDIVMAAGANGEPISLREADVRLREKLMVRLDSVPFAIDDDTFRNEGCATFNSQVTHRSDTGEVSTPAIPACISCHNCSATDHEFEAEIESAYGKGAIVCTEKPCHDFKVKVHFERKVKNATDLGLPIIDGEEARKVKPYPMSQELVGYIDLDAECKEVEGTEDKDGFAVYPTYREVLGKLAVPFAVLIDPYNKQPRELMPLDLAKKALKKVGVKKPPEGIAGTPDTPAHAPLQPSFEEREAERAETEKQQQREEQERVFRRKLLAEIHARWKGSLKRDDLQIACDQLMDGGEWPEFIDDLYGGQINTARMKEHELARLLFELTVGQCIDYLGNSTTALVAAAKRFRVDPAKVRKQIKAEAGETEPDEKKPAKKGKRK